MAESMMDELDFILKKMYGYWGWRYLTYLRDNDPEALILLMEREDRAEILLTLNAHCEFRMRVLMEERGDGEKANSHTAGNGIGRDLYRGMVEAAKRIVFDDCLELLQYASWMEQAPELKRLLEEFEEKNKE